MHVVECFVRLKVIVDVPDETLSCAKGAETTQGDSRNSVRIGGPGQTQLLFQSWLANSSIKEGRTGPAQAQFIHQVRAQSAGELHHGKLGIHMVEEPGYGKDR